DKPGLHAHDSLIEEICSLTEQILRASIESICADRQGDGLLSRREECMKNQLSVNRRGFLNALGVSVGGAGLVGAGMVARPHLLQAAEGAKGSIPDTPLKAGHMTFLTGAGAVLGEPSIKGHTMAAEEINAQGGLLGKRKIETITTDEAAGTDACVKELRRMKL